MPITLANGATENEHTVFVDSRSLADTPFQGAGVRLRWRPAAGLADLNAIGKFSIDAERGVLSFEGAVSASE